MIDVPRLVELMSVNPSRILGVDRGGLQVGAPADVTVLNLQLEREVSAAEFHSLSKNTPFDGVTLRGWPVATIIDGSVVWSRE